MSFAPTSLPTYALLALASMGTITDGAPLTFDLRSHATAVAIQFDVVNNSNANGSTSAS